MATKKEYNIGLDIGTTSVGWSVVETDNQKVMRKGNKALWGVRLFEEATTAESRRMQRSTRRRYDRRRERIKLLQEEFSEEINKVDKNFFQKLKESKYVENDKINKKIVLTKEEKQELKDYQNKYKTIYHLRDELINNPEKKDIRLVYLAIHHIIKYRGNFLYQNANFNIDNLDIKDKLNELFSILSNNIQELEIPEDYINIIDFDELEADLLKDTKNDVKALLIDNLTELTNKSSATEFGKLMVGNKGNINKLLMLETDNKIEISFSGTDYDDKYEEYQEALGENIEILDILKQIYDCIFLKKIFKGNKNTSISSLMVKSFEQHKKDLNFLKELFKDNRELYNEIFRTKKDLCLYEKYITNKIDCDEFRKEINKLLESLFSDENIKQNLLDEYNLEVKERIENGTFLPRITTTDNGKYPYQLNKSELIKIIENQGKYYPFLLNKLNDNKTYKIVKLLEFRIPYYVGPLVSEKRSENSWLERKINNVKITPYNFDDVVDKEKTAEKFIKRMISHCTYLLDEYALANNSILYSEFKVMNELKQIRVNDRKLELKFQQQILEDFFKKTSGTITERKFKNYLISTGEYSMEGGNFRITGYSADGKFANNMQSYVDFFGENGIFADTDYNLENAEEIIEWITIFEDKDILEKKVRDNYSKLNENQIKKVLAKKYSGWGSLSKKLLKTKYYKDKATELYKSILDLMYETDKNFMQIINDDKYNFQEMIKKFNNKEENKKLNYSIVEELATSPATKRGIYQALKVVEELVDYIGYEPKNISIEMARSEEEKVRKDSRKDYINNLYKGCKDSIENYKKLKHELDSHEITSQRLFLYFIQEGKCLYTGTPLNIEDIENQSLYEIDHIIPRSLIKDDSIDNKALVLKECNQDKKASYVLPSKFRNSKQKTWWKHLKDNGLMSAKKFHNLIREKYNEEDINGFINRQLVETRQITKHVANILNNLYKDTNVIYLKADLSHNYREKYDLFKFRDINDYHHAHDAYLAAVLGEYKERFMKRKINFDMVKELNSKIVEMDEGKRRNLRFGYVINSLDENLNDIVLKISENLVDNETGEVLFDAHEFNKRVEDTLYRNDILISRKTEIRTGQFYKETIYKKGKGTIPIKFGMPTDIYGGYSNTNARKLMLIEYNESKMKIIGLPMALAVRNNDAEINDYIKTQINLKKNSTFKIKKCSIPFETEIIYNNQNVFIKGYSIGHKNCEISNAIQLKIAKDKMKHWKYALQYLLNDKKQYIDFAEKYVNEIYDFLINLDLFPLFNKELDKIKNKVNFEDLALDQQKKITKELFKMLHCNSVNANLSEFGLGDRMGRLSGYNITDGIIISKSVTGIRESRYEF
ncbi:cRISPR-associated protein Csn1 family [Clostridium sp. CAG:451]|nr:cRISPR-associated protein Csn1 family [Clostridium sp. CAG:451]